jgi:ribosomal protein L2
VIYDSNRTVPICGILYDNGLFVYSSLVEGLNPGCIIFSGYSHDNINMTGNLG